MSKPNAAKRSYSEVEEGKKYFWCACGLSKKQPFGDGRTKQLDFQPFPTLLLKQESLFLWLQAQLKKPLCDGTTTS